MDRGTFDALTRRFAATRSRRGMLAALLGTVAALPEAGSLLARGRKGGGKKKGKGAPVLVCHNGKTFPVPREAVRGIELAGGAVGPCLSGDVSQGTCIPLENTCHLDGLPCCPNATCRRHLHTTHVGVFVCQSETCASNAECEARFPGQDVRCTKIAANCSGPGPSCCLPKQCQRNAECPHSGDCCSSVVVAPGCCAPGQTCSGSIGCFGPIPTTGAVSAG